MFRTNMSVLPRVAARAARTTAPRATVTIARAVAISANRVVTGVRSISSTTPRHIAILPDGSKEPANKADEPTQTTNHTPTEITEAQYHQLADDYLEAILNKFEELQDTRDDVDVEYSVDLPFLVAPILSTRTCLIY